MPKVKTPRKIRNHFYANSLEEAYQYSENAFDREKAKEVLSRDFVNHVEGNLSNDEVEDQPASRTCE